MENLNNKAMDTLKVIISGGGTGGHIFPAISIANAIMQIQPKADILFVGASGRMEMEKVPAAGYKIVGIPARGLKRPLYLPQNIGVALDYLKCRLLAKKIIKRFKPQVVVGVGGYASAAIVNVAANSNIPVLLQEQNSFAGLVNKKNSKKADKICVAYDGMERFFPKEKIIITGNPIRSDITKASTEQKEEAYKFYNLSKNKKTVFVVGGSLGCRTLNNCVKEEIQNGYMFKPTLDENEPEYQIIWQCGKTYEEETNAFMNNRNEPNVYYSSFIKRMDLAYAIADIVVSRAGAGTISELCSAAKCSVFVPSPIVAEDHQTHNAMALVNKNAAILIKDDKAAQELMPCIAELLKKPEEIARYQENIEKLALPNAAINIAKLCIKLANREI